MTMPRSSTMPLTRAGAFAGLVLAAVLLVLSAYLLLRPEGVTIKALVPVWLAALPLTGICAALGYGAGRLVAGPTRPRPPVPPMPSGEHQPDADMPAANSVPVSSPATGGLITSAPSGIRRPPNAPLTDQDTQPQPPAEITAAPPASSLSPRLRLGIALEQHLDRIEAFAARGPLHAVVLGVIIGISTIAGGIGLFIVVWAVLVNFFA